MSRIARLLGIAALGVMILFAFNHKLGHRMEQLNLAPEARRALDERRARLAGVELLPSVNDETRVALRQAINESFVFGFRLVMAAAAGMALGSALIASLMIEGDAKRRSELTEAIATRVRQLPSIRSSRRTTIWNRTSSGKIVVTVAR